MSLNDTIAAISTPLGEGGIGIVRLSGRDSISLACRVFQSSHGKKLSDAKSHTLTYGFVFDPDTGKRIDEALFSVMKAPNTYTREDIVEINCHGGILPLRDTLSLLFKNGARLADPGEFTKRAFLNGRIDLSQAEAVIDIIRSKTAEAERIALYQLEGKLSNKINEIMDKIIGLCAQFDAYIDFPEEGIEIINKKDILQSMSDVKEALQRLSKSYDEGRFFREGVSAAIVGKPNVGKSSLLNALLEKDRAIVTEFPGTTRDIIEDYLNINGLPLRIMDTAGIRESHEPAEKEGVRRSQKAIESCDLVMAIFDCSVPIDDSDIEIFHKIKDKKAIFIINKIDIESPLFNIADMVISDEQSVWISALKGYGIDELKDKIYSLCLSSGWKKDSQEILISNIRHRDSIARATKSLDEAEDLLYKDEPLEIAALLLREAAGNLGEITGTAISEDILNKIFSEFCIGK